MGQLKKQQLRMKRIHARNAKIREMYNQLTYKEVGKPRAYSDQEVFTMIADTFYMSEKTVEDIIFNRVKYKSNIEEK